jgi:hypothetical protein
VIEPIDALPCRSLTRTRTRCGPAVVNVQLGAAAVLSSNWPSSSRSQANASAPPSGSIDADASNWTRTGDGPLSVEALRSTRGGWLPPK